jgi:hypothetical protein
MKLGKRYHPHKDGYDRRYPTTALSISSYSRWAHRSITIVQVEGRSQNGKQAEAALQDSERPPDPRARFCSNGHVGI